MDQLTRRSAFHFLSRALGLYEKLQRTLESLGGDPVVLEQVENDPVLLTDIAVLILKQGTIRPTLIPSVKPDDSRLAEEVFVRLLGALLRPIDQLPLSRLAKRILGHHRVWDIGHLVTLSESQLTDLAPPVRVPHRGKRRIGMVTIRKIQETLASYGLRLGLTFSSAQREILAKARRNRTRLDS